MGATLVQLRYFVAVADAQSFARAAAELHVSPSTLSTQVRALEMSLGQPLLLRGRRRVELTTAGAGLHAALIRSLRDIDVALDAARAAEGPTALALAYTPSAGYEVLPALLDELQLMGHDPHAVEWAHRRVLAAVAGGKADAGLVRDAGHVDGLRVETVHRERMAVFLSERHAMARRASFEARDLAHMTLLVMPEGAAPGFARTVRRLCDAHGFTPRIREMDVPETRETLDEHLVRHPTLAFVGPASMATSSRPTVRSVPLRDPHARMSVDLITAVKRSRKAQIIADACHVVAAREGWLPLGGHAHHTVV